MFPTGPAKFIFRSAQQVTPLIFVHHSIIARFRLLGASQLYRASATVLRSKRRGARRSPKMDEAFAAREHAFF